ncbi:MAG: hypothetical protein V3S22_02405 [Candidatus Neomarinimicrobiota bacterium]
MPENISAPENISKIKREQAALYVFNALTDSERINFEAALKSSPALKTLVDELESTLNITAESLEYTPTDIELQGQRNLLRGRLEQIIAQKDTGFKFPAWDAAGRFLTPLFSLRQPALLVSCVLIAFLVGTFIDFKPFSQPAADVYSSADIVKLIESGALSNITLEETDKNNGGIRLAAEKTQNLNVSGGLSDESIQKVLFYLLLNDANPGKRLRAVELLKKSPPGNDKKLVLISSVLSDSNSGIRLKALHQLSTFKIDKIIREAALKVLLEDENEAVRMGALAILANSPTQDIIPALRVVNLMDDNQYIRDRAGEILSEMEDMAAADRIEASN